MAATPNPHTVRWFAGLFRECSQSVQQWETLAESRAAECDQLRCTIQALQGQINDRAAAKAFYDECIAEQASSIRSLASDHDAVKIQTRDRDIEHVPPRARTPWPLSTTASSRTACESGMSSEDIVMHPAKRMKTAL
ncbi:hypothetical protein MY4038_010056 [Beauveria bassiana]